MTVLYALLAQCAMCKDSLDQSTDASESILTRGFNSSVLFLLVLVFTLMGAIAFKVWRIMREEDRRALAAAAAAPAADAAPRP